MQAGFQFGSFELDLRARELRKHGIRLRLGDQSIEFLATLLERPGEIVTREEIQDRLWPGGTTVDFDHGINSAAKRLRDALGESSATPRFVETLPRRGYRFIGHATPIETARGKSSLQMPEETASSATGAVPAEDPEAGRAETRPAAPARFSRRLYGGATALLLIVATGGGLWKLHSNYRADVPPISSIAVLPLSNLSGDPERQYLADGLTDDLITELAQIRSLKIISRTSVSLYKDAKKSAREIGKELKVDAILEGSLAVSGNRIRITAQLIDCASDRHFWARRFDREVQDILSVQEDIARAVASEIRKNLAEQAAGYTASSRPGNPRASEAWLRAQFFLNARRGADFPRGVEYLEQAVQLDPAYALGWARLAHIRATRDFEQDLPASDGFISALRKSNELGQLVAETHMVNGDYEFFWNWDFAKGESEFRRAAELNPGVAEVRRHLAYCYSMLGRKPEALPEAERARELDPSSFQSNIMVAQLLFRLGRYEAAVRQFERTATLDARAPTPYFGLAQVYRSTGRPEEAAKNLMKCASLQGADAESVAALDRAFRGSGMQAVWRAFYRLNLERLRSRSLKQRVSPLRFAHQYAGAGEKEQALIWLRRAYRERCPHLPWIGEEEVFDEIRSDPRFQAILQEMKLPKRGKPEVSRDLVHGAAPVASQVHR